MTVRIVTDSTCDLPEAVAAAHNITVLPMLIQIGEQSFRDGVDISRRSFYECLPDCDPYPTTGAPGPEAFREVYTRLASEGATEILSIHIAASLSGVYDTARAAARAFTHVPVTVFDSRQISLGMGFQAETAAKAAASGASLEQILELLKEQTRRTHAAAVLDVFEYLQRSGRLNRAVAGLGAMLRFKPLLRVYNGEIKAEGMRTRQGATHKLVEIIEEIGPLERVALLHSHAPALVEQLQQRAQRLLPPGEIFVVDITPVIGVHTGPGAVGFVGIAAKKG